LQLILAFQNIHGEVEAMLSSMTQAILGMSPSEYLTALEQLSHQSDLQSLPATQYQIKFRRGLIAKARGFSMRRKLYTPLTSVSEHQSLRGHAQYSCQF
jgi:5-methylthioribose kinase